MLDWERRALELGPSDAAWPVVRLPTSFDPGRDTSGSAWWVTAFYAPEIWRRWGVGLLHGSLNLWLPDEGVRVEIPGVAAHLPEQLHHQGLSAQLVRRWQRVVISPVLVMDEALGFVIRGADTPPTFVEVFSPTHLITRLGIAKNQKAPVPVAVLPSGG